MFRYKIQEFSTAQNLQDTELQEYFCSQFKLSETEIFDFCILRKSLDTRKINRPLWKYNLSFSSQNRIKKKGLIPQTENDKENDKGQKKEKASTKKGLEANLQGKLDLGTPKIAIIGCGPAGMFAAYALGKKGYDVSVFEQGSKIEKRSGDIRKFVKQGTFHPESNILFGEGGAGTYSDGKLTSRSKNEFTREFFDIMVECGAPEDITYLARPHIGTDKLQFHISNLRKKTEALGVKYFFESKVSEIVIKDHKVTGLQLPGGFEPFSVVVCAMGLSSRNLLKGLLQSQVTMSPKGFSVGVRIEHPQKIINNNQLGPEIDPKVTGAAEYSLTLNKKGNRAYSFCMCPGGVVVPCADSENGIVTNGMSYHNRASAFANSALVVPLEIEDYTTPQELASPGSSIAFKGLEIQTELEEKAFKMGGGDFTFPAQTASSFLKNQVDEELPATSFQGKLKACNLHELFDSKTCDALADALVDFDRKIHGFIKTGLMIAPETRTSSAVRIDRKGESFESVNTQGLYPLGEGAGYAGGIVSSAADGLKWASLVKPANQQTGKFEKGE